MSKESISNSTIPSKPTNPEQSDKLDQARAQVNFLIFAALFSTTSCLEQPQLHTILLYEFDYYRQQYLEAMEQGAVFQAQQETQYGALHIIRITKDDGTGGAPYEIIQNQISNLNYHSLKERNQIFEPTRLTNIPNNELFFKEDTDVIDRAIFLHQIEQVLEDHYDPNRINIIWVSEIPKNENGFKPAGYFNADRLIGKEHIVMSFKGPTIDEDGEIMYQDNGKFNHLSAYVLGHEVGHFFGLDHTFAERSPQYCQPEGDCLEDTPYDPGSYHPRFWPDGCKVGPNCQSLDCPENIKPPDIDNIMSYYQCGADTSPKQNQLAHCINETVYQNRFFQSSPHAEMINLDIAELEVGCSENYCLSSIQKAIDLGLNTNDEIEITVHPGTYYENIDFPTKNNQYTVTIIGINPTETKISSPNNQPPITIGRPPNQSTSGSRISTLDRDITLKNLSITSPESSCLDTYSSILKTENVTFQACAQGAIYSNNSRLQLRNTNLIANDGVNFAGIYLQDSNLIFEGGIIERNRTKGSQSSVIYYKRKGLRPEEYQEAIDAGAFIINTQTVHRFRDIEWNNPQATDIFISDGEHYPQATRSLDCYSADGECKKPIAE